MAWTSTASTELDLPNGAKIYEGTFDAICGNFGHLGGTSGVIWSDWTPTLDQGGAVACSVTWAKWTKVGALAAVRLSLKATAAGASTNDITVGAIPAAVGPLAWGVCGSGTVWRATAGALIGGIAVHGSSLTLNLLMPTSIGGVYVGTAPSFALASSDVVTIHGIWPVSS